VTRQFTLGKNERLKSRKRIEQLFSEGKNLSVTSYRIFYLVNKIPDHPQTIPMTIATNIKIGVGVSGKNFKKAVDRNRIKRLTKEAYRLQKKDLQEILKQKKQQLNIFLVYTGKELPDFNTTKEKVNVILNRLITIIHENLSADT
jgi:ribonuclease P protein component